jgi:mannose-1-phosphate guanylyltransferase / mannose-6-phosphate isomerase
MKETPPPSGALITPVIMSGGAGTRLWPLSTRDHPKQFHALAGQLTLLQQTVLRCPQSKGFAAPILVCAKPHAALVQAQCEAVNTVPAAIITEPCPRNTAPCAVSAALTVQENYGDDACVLLLAADHYMVDSHAFIDAVLAGEKVAAQGRIVTFGAQPTSPQTGYGYIRRGDTLDGHGYAVNAFVEKPDLETARRYLKSGQYVWNAGIFLFHASVMLAEMKRHRPDILEMATRAWKAAKEDNGFRHLDAEAFGQCASQSVDYAVMENTDKAAMVPLDAGWSDVGAWPAIYHLTDKDADGNACHGRVISLDAENNLLFADKDAPMIAALGVENLAVIATNKAVLVTPLDQADAIKVLIAKLEEDDL